MQLNKFQFIGRLTKDPEVFYTNQGTPITNFTIAVNSGYGENEKTNFMTIKCFGNIAELAKEYLIKGQEVFVEGTVRSTSWEKNGEKKYGFDFVASNVQFGQKPKNASYGESQEEVPF